MRSKKKKQKKKEKKEEKLENGLKKEEMGESERQLWTIQILVTIVYCRQDDQAVKQPHTHANVSLISWLVRSNQMSLRLRSWAKWRGRRSARIGGVISRRHYVPSYNDRSVQDEKRSDHSIRSTCRTEHVQLDSSNRKCNWTESAWLVCEREPVAANKVIIKKFVQSVWLLCN